jgi:hypothetical protein
MKDGSYDRHLMPPEVKQATAAGERFYPRELASLVHEESSLLAKSAISDSIRRGENLVVDGTLSGQKSAGRLFEQLEQAGYKVTVASVEASRPLTEKRIAGRWRGGFKRAENGTAKSPRDAALGGRWVPGGLTTSLYPNGARQSVCRDVAEWAKQRFPAIGQLQRYRVNPGTGTPELEGKPVMAAPPARNGRTAARTAPTPAAARATAPAAPRMAAARTAPASARPPGVTRVNPTAGPPPAVARTSPTGAPRPVARRATPKASRPAAPRANPTASGPPASTRVAAKGAPKLAAAAPTLAAVPKLVADRSKGAKAPPPKLAKRPDRGHGR